MPWKLKLVLRSIWMALVKPNLTQVFLFLSIGNIHSVASALTHVELDCNVEISADHSVISTADKVTFYAVIVTLN